MGDGWPTAYRWTTPLPGRGDLQGMPFDAGRWDCPAGHYVEVGEPNPHQPASDCPRCGRTLVYGETVVLIHG